MKKLQKLTALSMVLLVLLSLSACGGRKGYEKKVGDNYFYYHCDLQEVSVDYWYDTHEFVYEMLTEEELKALFPVEGPEWMQLSGEVAYSTDGKLLWVELTTPLKEKKADHLSIRLGDTDEHNGLYPQYAGKKRSVCGNAEYVVLDDSIEDILLYEAVGLVQEVPVSVLLRDYNTAISAQKLQKNFEELLIYFGSCPDGAPDLSILTPPEEPEWFEYRYTSEEAYADPELGMYIPADMVLDEPAKRMKRPKGNSLNVCLEFEDYSIDWYIQELGSVYAELFMKPERNRVCYIDELTVEAIEEEFSTVLDAPFLESLTVVYEDVLINIYSYGADANTLYTLLTSVPTK